MALHLQCVPCPVQTALHLFSYLKLIMNLVAGDIIAPIVQIGKDIHKGDKTDPRKHGYSGPQFRLQTRSA